MVMAAKIYLVVAVVILVAYAVRHSIFSLNRLLRSNRHGLQDVFDSRPPSVTVLIPMHNEERVADHILEALMVAEYPRKRMEIIAIDDHSTDATLRIIQHYEKRDSRIRALHRENGKPGKPAALHEAIGMASGEILIVFDADYIPACGLLRELAAPFVGRGIEANVIYRYERRGPDG